MKSTMLSKLSGMCLSATGRIFFFCDDGPILIGRRRTEVLWFQTGWNRKARKKGVVLFQKWIMVSMSCMERFMHYMHYHKNGK